MGFWTKRQDLLLDVGTSKTNINTIRDGGITALYTALLTLFTLFTLFILFKLLYTA